MEDVITETRKLVINKCHGGFGLSEAAVRAYAVRKGLTLYPEPNSFDPTGTVMQPTWWIVPPEQRPPPQEGRWHEMSMEERKASNDAHDKARLYDADIRRDDPDLVAVVEELGEASDTKFSALAVVEIPADVKWVVEEYDGLEWIAEEHRTWS